MLVPHKVSPQEYINEEIKTFTKREKKDITRKENEDVDGDKNVVETSLVKITIELSQEDLYIDATKYFSGKPRGRGFEMRLSIILPDIILSQSPLHSGWTMKYSV
jgi:hypothetical protein